MSAYTTLFISRSAALKKIYEELPQMDNEQLERIVECILRDSLYNCQITADTSAHDDELL